MKPGRREEAKEAAASHRRTTPGTRAPGPVSKRPILADDGPSSQRQLSSPGNGAPETASIMRPMASDPLARHLLALREHLPELAEKYHVRTLEVFGSYVRNEQTATSDLDVLVTFGRTPTLFSFIELENHLSDILGVKVDLVMRDSLKPRLQRRILSELVPV
jgi:predicted nucleotidyltransferase